MGSESGVIRLSIADVMWGSALMRFLVVRPACAHRGSVQRQAGLTHSVGVFDGSAGGVLDSLGSKVSILSALLRSTRWATTLMMPCLDLLVEAINDEACIKAIVTSRNPLACGSRTAKNHP